MQQKTLFMELRVDLILEAQKPTLSNNSRLHRWKQRQLILNETQILHQIIETTKKATLVKIRSQTVLSKANMISDNRDIIDKIKEEPFNEVSKRISLKKPTHSYEVGEQKVANYVLPVNGKDFRFGKPSSERESGVSDCLQQEYLNSMNKTPIQSVQDDDYRISRAKDSQFDNKICESR